MAHGKLGAMIREGLSSCRIRRAGLQVRPSSSLDEPIYSIPLSLLIVLLTVSICLPASADDGEPPIDADTCAPVCLDLNGDGISETVALTIDSSDSVWRQYKLVIGDTYYLGPANAYPEGCFQILDIDSHDKFLEIAVFDGGPSDDPTADLYFFDGRCIRPMGTIQGHPSTNGQRRLFTTSRGQILHTWFFPDEYTLTRKHTLLHVDKPLYEMNTHVTILQNISVRRYRRSNSPRITIQAGETAIIDVTDDREWCHIRSSSGRSGWFSVEKDFIVGSEDDQYQIPFNEIFDGLSYAD